MSKQVNTEMSNDNIIPADVQTVVELHEAIKKQNQANKMMLACVATLGILSLMLGLGFMLIFHDYRHKVDDLNKDLEHIASSTDATNKQINERLDTFCDSVYESIEELEDLQTQVNEENKKTFKKIWNSLHNHVEELENEIELVEQAKAENRRQSYMSQVTARASTYDIPTDGLTRSGGVNINEEGHKETYYNLNMSGVVNNAKSNGIEGDYWVRDDGAKMYGDYVIVAADQSKYPYGTTVETSRGTGIVLDTGTFINSDSEQYDLAMDW